MTLEDFDMLLGLK